MRLAEGLAEVSAHVIAQLGEVLAPRCAHVGNPSDNEVGDSGERCVYAVLDGLADGAQQGQQNLTEPRQHKCDDVAEVCEQRVRES